VNGIVGNMTEEQKPQPPKSFILVVFEDFNSVAITNINTDSASPLQVMAAAQYLELLAKNVLVNQVNQALEEQRNRNLAVPKNQIIVPHGGK
jgi:hypothetical protein